MDNSKDVPVRAAIGKPRHLNYEGAAPQGGGSGAWIRPLSWIHVYRQQKVCYSHASTHNTTNLPATGYQTTPFAAGCEFPFVGDSEPVGTSESTAREGKQ